MKMMMLSFALIMSQASMAAIANSDYEIRHNDLIENAIRTECIQMDKLELISSSKEVIRVDQGIIDAKYSTQLQGKLRVDQNSFEYFDITVKTSYSDSYDHASKEHGVYSVDSVECSVSQN